MASLALPENVSQLSRRYSLEVINKIRAQRAGSMNQNTYTLMLYAPGTGIESFSDEAYCFWHMPSRWKGERLMPVSRETNRCKDCEKPA
jgi:hypothetical protein